MRMPGAAEASGHARGVADDGVRVGAVATELWRPAGRVATGIALVVFGALYYALSRLGLELTFPDATASTFWPAAGLPVAVLVAVRTRDWPAFLIVLMTANVLGNISFGWSVAAGFAFAVADALEALIAAAIIVAVADGRSILRSLRGALALIGGSLAPAVSTVLGVVLLGWAGALAEGTSYLDQWRTFALGDFAGIIVVTPLVLALLSVPRLQRRGFDTVRSGEFAGAVALVAVVLVFVYGSDLASGSVLASLAYLIIPPIVWIAVRFDPRATAIVYSLASVAIVALTAAGRVPFAATVTTSGVEIALVQGFIAVTVFSAMILAAVTYERARLTESVSVRNQALELAVEGVARLDADGRFVLANSAMADLLGRDPAVLIGTPLTETVSADDSPTVLHALRHAALDEKSTVETSARFAGRTVYLEVTIVRRPGDADPGYYAFARDVTIRRHYEHELAHRVVHDELTGLPNRRLLADRLDRALQRVERYQSMLAVLFVDLDRFKVVNDSLGHDVGDQLLRLVASRLTSLLGATDTLARFGGDEFVILLEDVEDEDAAVDTVRRIEAEFAEPFFVAGTDVYVSASVGIATANEGTTAPGDLLRHADWAMYRAKDAGHGYEVFDTRAESAVRVRLETESALRGAVDNDELIAFYQPIVRLADRRLVRCEALLRWDRPGHDLQNSAWFVPMAEESNLIAMIGRWVLGRAAEQAVRWHEDETAMVERVHVNVSATQLAIPDFADTVEDVLAEVGCDPGWLEFEITESALMRDPEACLARVRRLRELGARLSIDDFGQGYSSLAYLPRFPIDSLKLDMSLVHQLDVPAVNSIVRAVLWLANDLGVTPIAEGIETEAQLEMLMDMGLELGQGNLLGRPSVAADLFTGQHRKAV